MRDDDLGDSGRKGRSDRAVNLGAAEVARREHEPVPGHDLEHRCQPVVEPHRIGPDSGGLELILDRPPDRLLGGLRPVFARLVLGVDGREPDDPRAAPSRDLDRLRIETADARVERDRAEGPDPGHRRAHDGGSLGRRRVVRLEDEARQAELGEPPGEPEIVDPARRQVRLDVNVEVVAATNELAGAGGWLSDLRRQAANPPRAPAASP